MVNKPGVNENSIAVVGWHDGAAGQICSWLEETSAFRVACFINPDDTPLDIDPSKIKRDVSQFDYPTQTTFKNRLLINASRWVERVKDLGITKALVTTDDCLKRHEQIQQARKAGLTLINAIHPTVTIMPEAKLEDNIILYPNTFIGYRAELQSGVFVISAHLDHHNVMRGCVTIDPGVVFAGNVTIGAFSRVHTGAVIKNRIRVGEGSIVGAGAVVIRDVEDHVTVVGVPAKVIKNHVTISSGAV